MRIALPILWLLLTATAAAAFQPAAGPQVHVLSDTPFNVLYKIDPRFIERTELRGPSAISPDGRYVLYEYLSFGDPEPDHEHTQIIDLRTGRMLKDLHRVFGIFISGGHQFLYWQYDIDGSKGLYLMSLPSCRSRRIYPLTVAEEQAGSFDSFDLAWNPRTDEVACGTMKRVDRQGGADYSPGGLYLIRLRDSRIRRIHPFGMEMEWSRDFSRLVFTVPRSRVYGWDTEFEVWIGDTAGHRRQVALLSSTDSEAKWLRDGRVLLCTDIKKPVGEPWSLSVSRVDRVTGAKRSLWSNPIDFQRPKLSPSRRWCSALAKRKLHLIDTMTGAETPLPVSDVRNRFWGTGDGDLIYETPSGWRRLRFRVEGSRSSFKMR